VPGYAALVPWFLEAEELGRRDIGGVISQRTRRLGRLINKKVLSEFSRFPGRGGGRHVGGLADGSC